MVDYFHIMDVTKTARIDWFPQRHRNFTVAPGGDILVEAMATHGYRLNGILALASELLTFNRADELAEYYEQPVAVYLWGYEPLGLKRVYCRTDDHGNFWAVPDRPVVHKYVGTNEATLDIQMRLIGTTADYQACFKVEDVDVESSDWNI